MINLLMSLLLGVVPPLLHLQDALETVRTTGQPLVLYVSRSDCTFCRAFEKDILQPLIRSQVYAGKVQFFELRVDDTERFTDGALTAAQLAEHWDIQVTPTLLFLDHRGCELTRRRLGYSGNEFYGYYFERSIDAAIAQIAHRTEPTTPNNCQPLTRLAKPAPDSS